MTAVCNDRMVGEDEARAHAEPDLVVKMEDVEVF